MTTMLFYIMWDDCCTKRNQSTSYLLYNVVEQDKEQKKLDKIITMLCEKED